MIELEPLCSPKASRDTRYKFWMKNAGLAHIVSAINHGSMAIEYRTQSDGAFRVTELFEGGTLPYPEAPEGYRDVVFEFYRSHFEISSNPWLAEASIFHQPVFMEFDFKEDTDLTISFKEPAILQGQCDELRKSLWNAASFSDKRPWWQFGLWKAN